MLLNNRVKNFDFTQDLSSFNFLALQKIRGDEMAKCEVCGNDYDKSFEVVINGSRHTFDSFECAIHAVAPVCDHCGCKIMGHGVEAGGSIFCCASCAEMSGITELRDRV